MLNPVKHALLVHRVQTPDPVWRADRPSADNIILVTAATSSLASSLGNLLVNQLVPSLTSLPWLLPKIAQIGGKDSITNETYFDGGVLSELGLQLGTSTVSDSNYYVQQTFFTVSCRVGGYRSHRLVTGPCWWCCSSNGSPMPARHGVMPWLCRSSMEQGGQRLFLAGA